MRSFVSTVSRANVEVESVFYYGFFFYGWFSEACGAGDAVF